MADNIFDATLEVDNDVKINNFDWSHANNLTTQIGRITPIFCDMVPAKTSFRVNPRFGLQFMPMVFPIQTRMKARISFFRYPLRALWKDYTDFVGNFRDNLEEPYLNFNTESKIQKMGSTGSLGDYLGLPTTLNGDFGQSVKIRSGIETFVTTHYPFFQNTWSKDSWKALNVKYGHGGRYSPSSFGSMWTKLDTISESWNKTFSGIAWKLVLDNSQTVKPGDHFRFHFHFNFDEKNSAHDAAEITGTLDEFLVAGFLDTSGGFVSFAQAQVGYDDGGHPYVFVDHDFSNVNRSTVIESIVLIHRFSSYTQDGDFERGKSSTEDEFLPTVKFPNPSKNLTLDNGYFFGGSFLSEIGLKTSPWYNSDSPLKDKQQKILAYSFRAYEGIYNSYFRDNRNNPYYLDGKVQYNKWIPTDEGGKDDNLYELRYANWEKDFLTTAVQSPQQGNAPLVGLTTYTQTVTDENGVKKELIKTSLVDEDGKKYGLSFTADNDGLVGVEYLELDNGTAVRQARSLYDLATSGISIPDLRMVNCYQKFLELNMRKGYSYKEIVEGRFDVKIRYADLLLPEFFGGVSRDIDVNAITQTVDQNVGNGSNSYAGSLGSQSGLAGVRGEANANIECFCDEESIIIGVLVVTPLPVYTQLLPKHFTYRGLLEHFQPEFNLIGFQPIKYNEVCPIQAFNDNPDTLFDTFGYNRPWYEYVQKVDTAHGLFRTSLSNFLMHRVFDKKPELAQSFLIVDPEQVTDVFSVTETTDKIYGQIWLDITARLPIARVAIPRLD